MSDPETPTPLPTAGEPGTVAITVPGKGEPQAPSYRHEPETASPKLRVSNLHITYIDRAGRATEAVRDVSFDIADKPGTGEIVVFLGPSGCGKSTILKSIAGLLSPTQGEILMEGKPVEDVGRDRGMVFQTYTSFGWLTVRKNLEYGLRLQGVPKEKRRELSDKYLQSVGLAEFADRYPKDLSGGMKQRVAIARTLINRPRSCSWTSPSGRSTRRPAGGCRASCSTSRAPRTTPSSSSPTTSPRRSTWPTPSTSSPPAPRASCTR